MPHTKKWVALTFLLLIAILGTRFQNWVLLKGSKDLIHGDLGDSRFVNLLLEHAWQFVSGSNFLRGIYWDAPWNFYPAPRTLLMSEVMGGAAWNYMIFRGIGFDPGYSYQLWFISTSLINFFSFYALARLIGFQFWGSVTAAWIFAFGLVRGAFIAHPQLMPHYYSVWAIMFCVMAWRTQESTRRPIFLGFLAGICVGLQFWASFYLVWFSILCVILGFALALAIWKKKVLVATRKNLSPIIACGLGFLVVAMNLAIHYLSMMSQVGGRKWSDVVGMLPKFRALFLPSPEAWLHHWLFQLNYNVSGWYSEMFMFPGFAPLIIVLICLRSAWRKPIRLAEFCALLWLVMMLVTQHDLWKTIYYVVPGAGAIRAVGRIALTATIPLGICVAGFVDAIDQKSFRSATLRNFTRLLVVVLVIIDNGVTPNYGYSKTESDVRVSTVVHQMAGKACDMFHYAAHDTPWKVEIDAMWASMTTQIPTMNGYSGGIPSHYSESGMTAGMGVDIDHARKWVRAFNIEVADKGICMLKFKS